MLRMVVVLALVSTTALADDVNLLTSTPTKLAVSSTVANANILPDHLVDGKLSTAWNSQTGELAGAWIAVRVPDDARVKTIKLTAGFAHKVKKDDFFTMNPRIKKIRISQAGKTLVEKTLDVENRGLQDIAVDIGGIGGDFEIRVVETVPGSKKTWREACISELEIWGTVPAVVKSKPSVRIHALDAAPTLTREQCIKAAAPERKGKKISFVEALPLGDAIVVCRVDLEERATKLVSVELAAVKRTRFEVIGRRSHTFVRGGDAQKDWEGEIGSVQTSVMHLTQKEDALLVVEESGRFGPMMFENTSVSTLYRATADSFASILEWTSTRDQGEASDNTICELGAFTLGKAVPSQLVVRCEHQVGHWHDENPDDRGIDVTEARTKFRWNGTSYEPK